jgi:hypothetical protein
MSGIIIYSSFFPKKDQLFRGVDFLNMVKIKFLNYRVYIGIQTDTIPEWEEIIIKFKNDGLDIIYGYVNPSLYINSDVSGYQKAIELLKNDKRKINGQFIWFGHSKGVTTNNLIYHEYCLKNFWEKKTHIESRLNSDSNFGCYGTHISFLPHYDKIKITNIWKNYSTLEHRKQVLPFMFVNTFFVIKLHIFEKMLDGLNSEFFESKLNGHNGVGDRYFFERDFIHFVDILGYLPIFEEVSPNNSWLVPDKNTIEKEIELWKKN